MSQIRFFTEEQEALIPQLQAKWQSVSLSTEPIDRDRASAALREVYAVMGKPEPEIIFCDSPHSAIEQFNIYVSQVEIPQVASKSPEELITGLNLNFFKLFINTFWHII